MRNIKIFLILFLFLSVKTNAFYNKQDNLLILTILNTSSHTLNYTGVTHMDTGTSFWVIPSEIVPSGAATIIGLARNPYLDLQGKLEFIDPAYHKHILTIFDPRRIHAKKPLFSLQNEKLISFVKSISPATNPHNPSALSYKTAIIAIKDNIDLRSKKV